jgi:hypothetical protein
MTWHTICGRRAKYKNREYKFTPIKNGMCLLDSQDPKDIANGFIQMAEGRLVKRVQLEEIESIVDLKVKVTYMGDEFDGTATNGYKISLVTDDVELYEKHHMNMRDRFDYWLEVDLKDVEKIAEIRSPRPEYMKRKESAGQFAVDKNRVTVNGRSVAFNRDVAEYLPYEDTLIVLLNIMDKTEYENLYCVDANAKVIWRIQDVREALPDLTEQSSIFSLMRFFNGVFTYDDFLNRSFKFDPKTGKITGKYGS